MPRQLNLKLLWLAFTLWMGSVISVAARDYSPDISAHWPAFELERSVACIQT